MQVFLHSDIEMIPKDRVSAVCNVCWYLLCRWIIYIAFHMIVCLICLTLALLSAKALHLSFLSLSPDDETQLPMIDEVAVSSVLQLIASVTIQG